MIYYFLPASSVFGGIKVGFQFAQLLNELGVSCVVATADGSAPTWFQARTPVVSQAWAIGRLEASDRIIFSLPHDYPRLRDLDAELVFHCNGTDPLVEPIIADRAVRQLTCWRQATDFMRERGADPVQVGISISDPFYYGGQPKQEDTVCYMPRRGADLVADAVTGHPRLSVTAIDGLTEVGVAAVMQRSSVFLATSEGEWFGLPALEAMAAGCVVVSVPVLGGMEYLHDGQNCVVCRPDEMSARLRALSSSAMSSTRAAMRHHAAATASRYRLSAQRARLRDLLAGPLSYLSP